MNYDVIVIGAGPWWAMCGAIRAAQMGPESRLH